MSVGGRREGAGRKKGSPNRTTAQRIAEVAAGGVTPLDRMLQVLRDPLQPAERRDWAAEKAAPYCHAKLAQKDVAVTQTFDVADGGARPQSAPQARRPMSRFRRLTTWRGAPVSEPRALEELRRLISGR
jgi:hypothetical protein